MLDGSKVLSMLSKHALNPGSSCCSLELVRSPSGGEIGMKLLSCLPMFSIQTQRGRQSRNKQQGCIYRNLSFWGKYIDNECFACVHVCVPHVCLKSTEARIGCLPALELPGTDSWEMSCGCRELNLGLLETIALSHFFSFLWELLVTDSSDTWVKDTSA